VSEFFQKLLGARTGACMIEYRRPPTVATDTNNLEDSIVDVLICQVFDRLPSCKVRSIVRLPENRGVEVAFSFDGRQVMRFETTDFDVGRRGAKTAALARFAAAGFGEAEAIYRFLVGLPRDMTGVLFASAASIEDCVGPGSPTWRTELVA